MMLSSAVTARPAIIDQLKTSKCTYESLDSVINNISNEGIVIQSLNDVLTKLCNNNIVCELSEYYGQLMQCGLVEILMNSTINISIEELLQDLELGRNYEY
eukprot:68236_1